MPAGTGLQPPGTPPAARGGEGRFPTPREGPGLLVIRRGVIKLCWDARRPQGQQSSWCGALAHTGLSAHGTCLQLPSQGKEHLFDSWEPGTETAKKGPSQDPATKHNCWPHSAVYGSAACPNGPAQPRFCVCVCALVPWPQACRGLSCPPGERGSAGAVAGLSEVTGISLDRKIHSLDLLIANI